MELQFRTLPQPDGSIRVETKLGNSFLASTWEHFMTSASLDEIADECGKEIALQHRRANLRKFKVWTRRVVEVETTVEALGVDEAIEIASNIDANDRAWTEVGFSSDAMLDTIDTSNVTEIDD
jgi:hypothetical protein